MCQYHQIPPGPRGTYTHLDIEATNSNPPETDPAYSRGLFFRRIGVPAGFRRSEGGEFAVLRRLGARQIAGRTKETYVVVHEPQGDMAKVWPTEGYWAPAGASNNCQISTAISRKRAVEASGSSGTTSTLATLRLGWFEKLEVLSQ